MEEAPLQLLWVLRHWSLIYCWQFNIWMSPTCFHRKNKCIFEQNFEWFLEKFLLTHYSPVLLFFTPWIHQKTFRFSDVFRGYRKATPGCNGLIGSSFCWANIAWFAIPTFDISQNEHDFLDTINLQHCIDNFFFFEFRRHSFRFFCHWQEFSIRRIQFFVEFHTSSLQLLRGLYTQAYFSSFF